MSSVFGFGAKDTIGGSHTSSIICEKLKKSLLHETIALELPSDNGAT